MSSIVCQVSCTCLPSPHGFQNGTQYSLALPPPPPTPAEIPPILSTLLSPFKLDPGFRPLFSGSSSFESALNYVCILNGTIVFDIFFINPKTKPLFILLPFPHGHIVLTGGSRPGAPHHRRHHPKTPGGGPASPSSCRARSAPRHESPGHASVHEQPGCPPVEAGEAG